MLSVSEAEALILQHVHRFSEHEVALADAVGCVLREDLLADRDWPPFDRSTMDGIAVAAGARTFTVEGVQPAGQPAGALRDRRTGCLRIMTGAMLPAGADAVIPCEDYEIDGDRATLRVHVEVKRGQFIHRQGLDRKVGDELLTRGTCLLGPQLALLASSGRERVKVARAPAVAVASIGDELVELGEPLAPYQIRPSNAYGVEAGLRQLNARRVERTVLRDDPMALERELARLLDQHELIILSGGVSKGAFDFVPQTLAKLGVQQVLHRVAQKPGQPLWFGVRPGGATVFALPGNPVATLVCFHRYVIPWWWRSAGALMAPTGMVTLASRVELDRPLTHFLPVRLESGEDGEPEAMLVEYHGSGDHASLGHSHGFIELPPAGSPYPAGARVRYYGWHA